MKRRLKQNKARNPNARNDKENETPKIKRKPGAWDPDYDYDDADVQRIVQVRPGVKKMYLTEDTYYLRIMPGFENESDYQESDYQDTDYQESDYYKDNYKNDESLYRE